MDVVIVLNNYQVRRRPGHAFGIDRRASVVRLPAT